MKFARDRTLPTDDWKITDCRPAIVVSAFSRPVALQRLLSSLQQAHYPKDVRLVISIDRTTSDDSPRRRLANETVCQLARELDWPYGPKDVILHDEHLGLIGNFFFCGGLSQQYGAIILLEDDLYVSRAFYVYSQQAIDFYRHDARIAGVALNSLWFNGYTHQPFIPYLHDSDVFFLPIAWYQGQVYTAEQWAAFAAWYETVDICITPADHMHEMFSHFPDTDWFPIKTKYLVDSGRTYVFPRESLTTNFGEIGTHFPRPTHFFQVPLQHFRHEFQLQSLDSAVAVYDAFFEILPDRLNRLTEVFSDYNYDIDLYATKSSVHLQADYVLTTRSCRTPLCTFGKVMRPMEANVVANVPGKEIVFCRKEDLGTGWLAHTTAEQSNHDYFNQFHRVGRRQHLRYNLATWSQAILKALARRSANPSTKAATTNREGSDDGR
jgi:hypothetical protein